MESGLAVPARHCYHSLMRWRSAMAVLAVLIAGAVYVATQPRKGTVEWHKREYENHMRRLDGKKTLFERIRSAIGLRRPDRQLEHRSALIDLGYLEEREIVLTNNPKGFSQALVQWATNEFPENRLWVFGVRSNNVMFLRAERHNMKKWEEAVRRIDLSQKSH